MRYVRNELKKIQERADELFRKEDIEAFSDIRVTTRDGFGEFRRR